MLTISGYQIDAQIYESSRSLVYRGHRQVDDCPVVVKLLKQTHPTASELARYRQEYRLTHSHQLNGVIKAYSLEKYQNTLAIVFEDFGAESLRSMLGWRSPSLLEKLEIAIQVAQHLEEIHAAHIIHKDINPANIVFNLETRQSKLIDFGLATVLPRQNLSLEHLNSIEGTLAYLSPEQTGRMNRSLDYRTDFYSFGVTCYELFTGQLPFQGRDVVEWVHAHLAVKPSPPHTITAEIPSTLSAIVMKLLAKNAEERYQSAWGICADLCHCRDQLLQSQTISPFPIAQSDRSSRFQIPEKLYGREQEIAIVLEAFERVAGDVPAADIHADIYKASAIDCPSIALPHSEMVLVSGHAGIGKSALVQEIYRPITRHRGFFAAGKFDQFQRSVPYSAVIQALQDLLKQLLLEDDAQLNAWRDRLTRALGQNIRVVTGVVPALELITGSGPAIPTLSATETQNRFDLAFQSLIQVFAQAEHPLVLFLDDLQWADSASLRFIKRVISSADVPRLFLIGAYRDNEVTRAHPLSLTIDEIQQNGTVIHRIALTPLELTHINRLVAETLSVDLAQTAALAQLILEKTGGNPFFVNELLTSFHTDRLIYFDYQHHLWQWDMAVLGRQSVTDNVVELLAHKLQKRSPQSQTVLQVAASIGNLFDLSTLAAVLNQSEPSTAALLHEAIAANLIQPLDPAYTLADQEDLPLGDRQVASYQFIHDRVQQAAYFLNSAAQRQEIHWRIGQHLLDSTPPEQQEQRIFDTVNQLNAGHQLNIGHQLNAGVAPTQQTDQQRHELAGLNLQAGQKAKAAAAYRAALDYLKTAMNLVTDEIWQTDYEMAIALYSEATEVALLCQDFEQMEAFAVIVHRQGRSPLDRVQVYEVQIQARIAQDRPMEAIAIACQSLSQLGLPLPQVPSRWRIEQAFWNAKLALGHRSVASLIDLPTMDDPTILAAMRILSRVISAASLSVPNLFVLIAIQMLTLSIRYGNTPLSAHAYANFGLILCGVRGDIDLGYRFGQLALEILARFDAKDLKAKVLLVVNDYVIPWKRHINETLDPFLDAYQSGLETGDLEYAARSAMVYGYHSYFLGCNLDTLEREMKAYSEAIAQLRQRKFAFMNERYRQIVLNLLARSDDPCRLVGEAYNEDQALPEHQRANDKNAIFNVYLHKAILCYLFQQKTEALHYITQAKPYLGGATGLLLVPIFYFYESLIDLATYPQAGRSQQRVIMGRVNQNRRKLRRWATDAPSNHLHKYYLVEAERHQLLGHWIKASAAYDRAIELAKQHQYVNEEAIAQELAAQFYLRQGKFTIAQAYMLNAHYCYSLWGATAKVTHLNQQYPELLALQRQENPLLASGSTTNSNSSINQALDLASVIQASQAISSEVALDKLLVNLMKILMENAGAQQGCLILETRGKLCIEAQHLGDAEAIQVLQSLPIEALQNQLETSSISPTIVNYVAHTQDPVVLNHATQEGAFIHDPYIQFHQPQSILCAPLINQGKLSGIVYLENRLVKGAFTSERLTLVNLLSTQAAISIENSRYYTQISQLNQAYERFVPNQFLQFLNKESIVDVKLGDQVQREMSVLFADIRDFTRLSEAMTPEENFRFINAFLSRMEPVIAQHNGFIDKYIGDAIMALFSGDAEDALKAAIAMLEALVEYNQLRLRRQQRSIRIGIGINTGSLMLGTVGGANRMDSTVISDTVNLASRIEQMTKIYAASVLISEHTFTHLRSPEKYAIRRLDAVKIIGKSEPITIYEVFEADPPELKTSKLQTQPIFDKAIALFSHQDYAAAADLFKKCLSQSPHDSIAQIY
ncbi:MAG: AAA family ATPase, partial [Elainellaceae cyanobacterium]